LQRGNIGRPAIPPCGIRGHVQSSGRKCHERRKLLIASPQTSVSEASVLMARKNVGAVLVVEDESLVGIFTERDGVFRVIAKGRDPRATLLAEVMTAAPKTVDPEQPYPTGTRSSSCSRTAFATSR